MLIFRLLELHKDLRKHSLFKRILALLYYIQEYLLTLVESTIICEGLKLYICIFACRVDDLSMLMADKLKESKARL